MLSPKLKYSIKVSLSITLAFLIPFSQGWEQVQTAAITIVLIATMGALNDSILKGAMRVLGTLIGAVIGLLLIATFPQERFLYLLSLSLCVSVFLYLVRAYKGDPSIFMLSAMTMMMMFDNGSVQDVFLFGVDKILMSVFGIIIYTLVGVFIWPDAAQDTEKTSTSNFIWGDVEDIKATLVTFLIFWSATFMWVNFNTPAGFMIVTLATGLSVLTTYTPLKPSILITVFTFSFSFAMLMYVFVLPNLHQAWELSLFIFLYSFIFFYFLPAQLSVLFLIGLFLLNITNQMQYNFNVFLLTLLMFYIFLIILQIFYYIPFSTKPEYLFLKLKNRFFRFSNILLLEKSAPSMQMLAWYSNAHILNTHVKMKLWASKINLKHFKTLDKDTLDAFIDESEKFAYFLNLVYHQKLKTKKDIGLQNNALESYARCKDLLNKLDLQALKETRF